MRTLPHTRFVGLLALSSLWILSGQVRCVAQSPAATKTPEQYFGFKLGTDGKLARYPKVLDYYQHLAAASDRMTYRELGKTTMGNPYVLAMFSSPKNLARIERLIEINRRLADPRGLDPDEARKLVAEGRPFYFLYATIHSSEIGNGQTVIEIAHEMTKSDSPEIRTILDDAVLLLVPSQNPDGQVLLIDHYYKHLGTRYSTGYPDLYHKYTGHDDNRDWFMFTQIETRLNVEKVQNTYRPQITHDMHQMGNRGFRMFVPPFVDPYDPNIHPILSQGQARVGIAMASALVSAGQRGVGFYQRFDLWTPARQYMVYHGQPRILTEIASVHFAMPQIDPGGKPLGPQERRWNFPMPYRKPRWDLRDIMDYGKTAVYAGLTEVAKYHDTWMQNFYQVHRDWVERTEGPFAFVIPADQRDPFETYELLRILEIGDVEIHRANAAFAAGGRKYPAGSFVVLLAQPYGAFAKTMLERQRYPDLRAFPGGPPLTPYDVTGHSLGLLLGVRVEKVEARFDAELTLIDEVRPVVTQVPTRGAALLIGPESNAAFRAVAELQAASIPVVRSRGAFESAGRRHAPGTFVLRSSLRALSVLDRVVKATGLVVHASDAVPRVDAHRLRQPTRVGLWKGANNMPGGWMKWLLEQYHIDHRVVSSHDFEGDLSAKYDAIVLPSGTDKRRIVRGLDPRFHDREWSWAYGVRDRGWNKLRQWVLDGGTLVALGTSVETVREMFDLPITPALPAQPRRGQRASSAEAGRTVDWNTVFQSPANLMRTLDSAVVSSRAKFYCPGSLLRNVFDVDHPIGYGMPAEWSVFFRNDQAYALSPGFGKVGEVVSHYPSKGEILESGWLLGGELLRDRANAMSFRIGRGSVVALASKATFRTQTRATFKLLLNAIFQGPAEDISARDVETALR